jgi:hypothetical protein
LIACLKFIGWLWALPLTLLGLPFWLGVRVFGQAGQAAFQAGAFTAHSGFFKRCLAYHPFGQMQAVALGCCVFASDERALLDCFPHEQVHVRQAMQWGVFFPLAYLISSLWQRINGRCAYADNWFERQAEKG